MPSPMYNIVALPRRLPWCSGMLHLREGKRDSLSQFREVLTDSGSSLVKNLKGHCTYTTHRAITLCNMVRPWREVRPPRETISAHAKVQQWPLASSERTRSPFEMMSEHTLEGRLEDVSQRLRGQGVNRRQTIRGALQF